MRPQGYYQNVEFKHGVLTTRPKSAFNSAGVQALVDIIRSNVPKYQPWVLFERPMREASLTFDATQTLAEIYASLAQYGCIGIAIEVPEVFGHSVKKHLKGVSAIPIYTSENVEKLTDFIQRCLVK